MIKLYAKDEDYTLFNGDMLEMEQDIAKEKYEKDVVSLFDFNY